MSLRSRRPLDTILVGLLIGVCIFGLIVLLSASGPVAFQAFSDPLYFVRRQIFLGLIPGGILFYVISRFDVNKLKPFAFPALIATLVLLASVFIPGLGHRVGGSTSWIDLRFIRIQPSEFAKVTFIVYAAGWLASRGKNEGKTVEGAMPFFLAIAAVIILLALQPDTGSMCVLVMTIMCMYFVAGAPILWFGTLFAGIAGAIALMIKLTPYRAVRFMTFLHPELDPQGVGYHINQAFLAIGSGGIFGYGYNQSRQKFLYLPEAQDDSIFAIMAEELGLIVCVLFLLAVSAIVWRCLRIAKRAPDDFQSYLCIGIASWIAVQAIVNIASMTGLMPMTGVTLPFVSYGNSATVSLFIGLGLVAAVSRSRRSG
ncbi:MAG: putative lipid II flippase FtsW [Patescibacteria group bacterium]